MTARADFAKGYGEAMDDIARILAEGGTLEDVATWVSNNGGTVDPAPKRRPVKRGQV